MPRTARSWSLLVCPNCNKVLPSKEDTHYCSKHYPNQTEPEVVEVVEVLPD